MGALGDLFPSCWEYADVYSERVKSTLLLMCSLSIVMMFTSPYGALYACMPRPFTAMILFMHKIPLPDFPTPEYGMHWMTIFIYCLFAYKGIVIFEDERINYPFHKIIYVFFLTMLTLYTPFEWIYITLMDIFHNIPVYGYPVIWMYGWWKDTISFIFESVIGVDGGLTMMSILGMYLIKKDLDNHINTKIRGFGKRSKLYLSLFLIIMFLWIIIPLYIDVPSFGTKWFPQTIYVEYGYFEDYGLPILKNGDIYGIVKEYWYPNITIKLHNHISKLFSVLFMFHTFLLRKVNPD